MNWGVKIIFGLGTFMVLVVSAGIYMVSKDTDSLVDDNYYEKSLVYDEVLQRKQNVLTDDVKPKLRLEDDTLAIVFARKSNKGELFFKRSSDGSLDVKIPFYTDSTVFRIPLTIFIKGSWTLDINWNNQGIDYFDTQVLYL